MTNPIHTPMLAGKPMRLYRSPLDGPDWPWVAMRDLLELAGFNQEGADHWERRWRAAFPDRTHNLPDGTVIVPGVAAQGLFEWGIERGWATASVLLDAYHKETGLAFCVIYQHASGAELRSLVQQACLRNALMIPGVTHVH